MLPAQEQTVASRDEEQPPVWLPVDAQRERLPPQDDLAGAVEVDGDDPTDAAQALRAGASGYVLKQAPESHLLTAIRRARSGRRFVDELIAARIVEVRHHDFVCHFEGHCDGA